MQLGINEAWYVIYRATAVCSKSGGCVCCIHSVTRSFDVVIQMKENFNRFCALTNLLL
jgi:hypothetical protein